MDASFRAHEPGADATGDEALMQAFCDGDAAAFEALVGRHQRGVYNFLLRSVGQKARAEELLQEVFLRVVRAKGRYTPSAKFTTWLYSIARNLSVDESRRAKFRKHQSLDAPRKGSDGDQGSAMISSLPSKDVPTDPQHQLANHLYETLLTSTER